MKHIALILFAIIFSIPLISAADSQELQQELRRLQKQSIELQHQLNHIQRQMAKQAATKKDNKLDLVADKGKTDPKKIPSKGHSEHGDTDYHSSIVSVHSINHDPDSLEFYPTALVAEGRVVTYIAGTPVVTSPYLGSRPAFDGSDYIVNISSINRDIRLMQQRRRLYLAYDEIGYPMPESPIVAFSGKVEPVIEVGSPFYGTATADFTLGTSELDTAAILNQSVEGYLSLMFDEAVLPGNNQRLANARIALNMGFVNIGNLEKTPFYFTGGQLYVPFGRFSTSMVSAPLTLIVGRTKSRPFILGYKSQTDTGPFAAVYAFRSDTNLGSSGVGGLNLGYIFESGKWNGDFGVSAISSITDAGGFQFNGKPQGPGFGGFASPTNGSEQVQKVPAVDVHTTIRFDRYNITAEWVGVTSAFRSQDLSFNGEGARPRALQLEVGMTFMAFSKPSTLALGYQSTQDALALNLPQSRVSGVFNISIWKDTVESLEYRHDVNYKINQYANGAAPPGSINTNTIGTGKASDMLIVQIGIYF